MSEAVEMLVAMAKKLAKEGDREGALKAYRQALGMCAVGSAQAESIEKAVRELNVRYKSVDASPEEKISVFERASAASYSIPGSRPPVLKAKSPPKWPRRLALLILLILILIVGKGVWKTYSEDLPAEKRFLNPNLPDSGPTPTAAYGSMISQVDGMELVYIPEGEFEMGSEDGYYDESPVHTVYLDDYWIDRTEVTNGMYARCVATGDCSEPLWTGSQTRSSYYGNPDYDNYPVINVNWNNAEVYCGWAGRRLPTEAEWEKAATGGLPAPGLGEEAGVRVFPWGVGISCDLANYDPGEDCVGDTSEAGSYPDGASPYGVLDMAGNVREWVADWYDEAYYSHFEQTNPQGPSSGRKRVLRGGSWNNKESLARATFRNGYDPGSVYVGIGFRCLLSP